MPIPPTLSKFSVVVMLEETLKTAEPEWTAEDEAWVQERIVAGCTNEVWDKVVERGDPATWKGRRARTVAARVFNIRGASRLAEAFQLRNFRAYPDDPAACYYGLFEIHRRSGPLRALHVVRDFLESHEPGPEDERHRFGDLWAYRGLLHGAYRDFDRAYACQDRAEELAGDDSWVCVQRAALLQSEDRIEESIAVAEEVVSRTPRYRAPVGLLADYYWNTNRDDEAFDLLTRGMAENDSAGHPGQLVRFYDEIEQFEEGLEVLAEYERRSPMADAPLRKWIAGQRCAFLYMLGRGEEMVPEAEASERDFYKKIAERVKSGEFASGKRVRLNVGFVRQNELTCAPATLTALSGFWNRPADHLEVAEEICYDGTSGFKERRWAEEQGWYTREFRADWETTAQLIDLGIPFTLATVEVSSAHLQAVIGYDSRAGTIVIRDPGHRHYTEALAVEFFKDYAFSGPRALILAPQDRAADIEALALPEADLYDLNHVLNAALEKHDRDEAQSQYEKLCEKAPDHRLTHWAERALAGYDDNTRGMRDAAAKLLELYPDAGNFQLDFFRRNRDFVTREDRVRWLREKVDGNEVLTVYYKELADLLSEDARTLDEALEYYRQALRFRQLDAETLSGRAGVLWDLLKYEEATELFWLAACLAERTEHYADSFFKACRWIRDTDAGLKLLRRRFEKHGHKAAGPAITYCRALCSLDRGAEMLEFLDEALERLPDNGELFIYAAGQFASYRKLDRAKSLLESSAGIASRAERLRLRAWLANIEGQPDDALAAWREILEIEPLAMDAHRAVARLLAEREGTTSGIAHLRKACGEFPNHMVLHETLVGWLRGEGPGRAEETIRGMIEKDPSNGWAMRELAIELASQGRLEEARHEAEKGVAVQPRLTWSHSILGSMLEQLRDFEGAAASYRKALELNVENTSALNGLIGVSETDDDKKAALEFIESELEKQVLFGEVFHTYRGLAYSVLEPDELLKALQRANEARPDLWETWSVLVEQFLAMGRPDDALETALELTKRFPVMPRAWFDLSTVYRDRAETAGEIAALEKALEINAQWDLALRRLAAAVESTGECERAIELLERAVAADPLVAQSRGCLADTLWKTGRCDEALKILLQALKVDPDYGWAWDNLGPWAKRLGREDEAVEEAELLTAERPSVESSWMRFAGVLSSLGREEESIEALERGLKSCPQSWRLRDQLALTFCNLGRFEKAVRACLPEDWEGEFPVKLKGREAWIENERGNRKRAIELMQATVAAHSDYTWGFKCLSDWFLEDERFDEALEAGRQLVRLDPLSAMPHGYVGDVLRRKEEKEAAAASFARALQLEPPYAFAAYHLAQLRIEAEKFDDAAAVLEIYDHHHPGDPAAMEMRVWLEAAREREEEAIDAFRRLCFCSPVAEGTLMRSEERLIEAGWIRHVAATYYDALRSGDVRDSAVAARWVVRGIGLGWKQVSRDLRDLELEDDVREEGWRSLIIELNRLDRKIEALRVVRRNRDIYRSSTALWASAGYVIRMAGKQRKARKWLADWRERDDLKPWMMINVAFPLLETRGIGGAGPAHKFAADELPTDHDTYLHHGCAAFYEAWNGNTGEARRHLDACEFGVLNGFYRYVYKLAEYLVSAAEEDRPDGRLFREAAMEHYDKYDDYRPARIYFLAAWRRTFLSSFRSGAAWFITTRALWLLRPRW